MIRNPRKGISSLVSNKQDVGVSLVVIDIIHT